MKNPEQACGEQKCGKPEPEPEGHESGRRVRGRKRLAFQSREQASLEPRGNFDGRFFRAETPLKRFKLALFLPASGTMAGVPPGDFSGKQRAKLMESA
jgi:hypothetical protein